MVYLVRHRNIEIWLSLENHTFSRTYTSKNENVSRNDT